MDWARRFFDYAGTMKGGLLRETPGAEDIREFLTHLASPQEGFRFDTESGI